MSVDSFYFRKSGITYNIKHPMTCTTRNLIYATICKNCGYTYVGETINLRSRMSAHRSNSKTLDAASQACSKHRGGHFSKSWGGELSAGNSSFGTRL